MVNLGKSKHNYYKSMRSFQKLAFIGISLLFVSNTFVIADEIYVGVAAGGANGQIMRIDANGKRSVFATGISQYFYPQGLAFDNSWNLYVSNLGNGTIEKYSQNGIGSLFSPNFVNGTRIIDLPQGIAFDHQSSLFLSDNSNPNRVTKFDLAGNGINFSILPRDASAGITCDQQGHVFAADNVGNNILRVDSNGQYSVFASNVNRPFDLAFDRFGDLFVSNLIDGTITKITPNGHASLFASGLMQPMGLAFDSEGFLYVGDAQLHQILKYDPLGNGSIFADSIPVTGYIAIRPVPEPSVFALFAIGTITILRRRAC